MKIPGFLWQQRSFVGNKRFLFSPKGSKVRFMDTMSLHMAISGLTGFQRTLWMANKLGKRKGLQEVKEHIKKTGQKKQGPAVCVLNSPYWQQNAFICFIVAFQLFTYLRCLLCCSQLNPLYWNVSIYRLAPGTGWTLVVLITWLMFMHFMLEDRRCRKKSERPLWKGAWWMLETTFRLDEMI